jgi:hypothetical protein
MGAICVVEPATPGTATPLAVPQLSAFPQEDMKKTARIAPGGPDGTPGRIRTCGLWVRNPTLYPLSYRRAAHIVPAAGIFRQAAAVRREGRDSNPRRTFKALNRLAGGPIRPLWHLPKCLERSVCTLGHTLLRSTAKSYHDEPIRGCPGAAAFVPAGPAPPVAAAANLPATRAAPATAQPAQRRRPC